MTKIYYLYEWRIAKKIKDVKEAITYNYDICMPENYPLDVAIEYMKCITEIISGECSKDEDAIRKLIEHYIPRGFTLRSIKRKDSGSH